MKHTIDDIHFEDGKFYVDNGRVKAYEQTLLQIFHKLEPLGLIPEEIEKIPGTDYYKYGRSVVYKNQDGFFVSMSFASLAMISDWSSIPKEVVDYLFNQIYG
jgi:hypothetical protein